MKVVLIAFIAIIVSNSFAQTINYGLVYQVNNTTIYNPLDSAIFYEINDSSVVRLAKSNPTSCNVENAGNFYLRDESINLTGSTINTVDSVFIFDVPIKFNRWRCYILC
jgi:hypothetical protein